MNEYGEDGRVPTIPGPVGFEEGRIVDNGRKQGGEGPQEEGGEELGDDRILENRVETWVVSRSPTSSMRRIKMHTHI